MERRRRLLITSTITRLAELLPPPLEKNKATILARCGQYIQTLKNSEASNIEKWTLEKLLSDQAIEEGREEVDKWRERVGEVERENEVLRADVGRLLEQLRSVNQDHRGEEGERGTKRARGEESTS